MTHTRSKSGGKNLPTVKLLLMLNSIQNLNAILGSFAKTYRFTLPHVITSSAEHKYQFITECYRYADRDISKHEMCDESVLCSYEIDKTKEKSYAHSCRRTAATLIKQTYPVCLFKSTSALRALSVAPETTNMNCDLPKLRPHYPINISAAGCMLTYSLVNH